MINKLFETIIIDTENFLLEIFQFFGVIKVLFQNFLLFIFQYLLYLSDELGTKFIVLTLKLFHILGIKYELLIECATFSFLLRTLRYF